MLSRVARVRQASSIWAEMIHIPSSELVRRVMTSLVVALVGLAVMAPTAAADGVGPTNFRSEITGVEPEVGTVAVRIVGSDAFMEVAAEPGVTVEIPGYEGEPYLRIDSDGSVWRNESSPARYVNDSRSGTAPIPRDLPDPSDTDWRQVGSSGIVAWHDHRIHWMSSEVPATGPDGSVMEWQVPLTVDGVDVMVTGELFHTADQLPWPLLITAVVATAIVLAGLGSRRLILTSALLASSLAAVATTLLIILADPPDAGRSPIAIILAVAATIASIVALVPGELPPVFRLATSLGATALLIGWLIPLVGVFWMPYVPTATPILGLSAVAGATVRALTAAVAGVAIGSVITVALRPAGFLDGTAPGVEPTKAA